MSGNVKIKEDSSIFTGGGNMTLTRWALRIVVLVFPVMSYANDAAVAVDVELTAGSFVAKTKKVTGHAYKTKDGFAAENVNVDLRTLTTGVSLRDEHTKKRLKTDKFPYAKLIKASGKNGKGTATLEIKGMKVEVVGTYEASDSTFTAKFPIHLENDLKITDVNYMGIGVEDTVQLTVSLPIKEKSRGLAGHTPAPSGSKGKK